MMRSARSRAWKAAIAVAALAVIGAACAPIAPSPPPPPPPPPTTSPPPPPPPAGCNEEPATPGAVEYFATVDDGDAVDEAVPFEASSQAEYEQKVDEIEAVEGPVIAVEVDQPVSALAIDDPRAGEQWGITAASFEQAWTEAGSQGASVTVAVLDTGSQAAHEDLTGGVIQGADYAEGTPPQGTSDYGRVDLHGGGCASGSHGTHVAGIVGARDNTVGGVGGAPGITILPVRVLNSTGSGSYSDVIAGIDFAVAQNADVISMSLGGGGSSTALADAVSDAQAAGVVVIAAAGNSGAVGCLAPAIYAIAVGATVQSGGLASYSNRGSCVDIAAPGSGILSTVGPNGYANKSGTSMATPYVSAAAALLLACGVDSAQIESALEGTASPLGGIQGGSGLLDAGAAAQAYC